MKSQIKFKIDETEITNDWMDIKRGINQNLKSTGKVDDRVSHFLLWKSRNATTERIEVMICRV